jgi:hypothetical protein
MCVGMQSELDEASTLFFYVRQKKSAMTVDWNVKQAWWYSVKFLFFCVESKVAGLDHSDRTRTRLSYNKKIPSVVLSENPPSLSMSQQTHWKNLLVRCLRVPSPWKPRTLINRTIPLQPLSSQNYCHFLVSNLPCPKPLVLQPCSPFNSAIASTNLPCSASNLTRCLSRSGSSASNCAQTAASSTFKLFNRAFCT